MTSLRASTIKLSQRTIKNKLIYFYLVGGKRRGERRKRALREEPALARPPRHFVRMKAEPHNKKKYTFLSTIIHVDYKMSCR